MFLPVVHASSHIAAAESLVAKIKGAILFPLISLLLAVALLIFLWGGYRFIANADDDTERTKGKQSMLFGIVGMLIMLSAFAILQVAADTFGVGDSLRR